MKSLQYLSIRDLVQSGYFQIDKNGNMRIKKGVYDVAIDMHTHLGLNYYLARPIDLFEENLPIRHMFPENGAPVNLSHYSGYDFYGSLRKKTQRESMKALVSRNCPTKTHTVWNLLDEMDRMGIEQSTILAIDMGSSRNSFSHLAAASLVPRFNPYVSIPPKRRNKRNVLEHYIRLGARGIKIHPIFQFVKPISPNTVEICSLADEYHVPVLFHCGHSPICPAWQKRFVKMNDYKDLIHEFPNVTFVLGHSGMDEYEDAVEIAKKNDRVFLELSGQPPDHIKNMVKLLGSDRLFFGSDWPFYPIALPLVKVLIATEGNTKLRTKILYTNAKKFLKG